MRFAVLVISLLSIQATANGERPIRKYIQVEPPPGVLESHHTDDWIIFMNRDGGTYYYGWDDSRYNQSSILYGTETLSAYPYGDDSWNEVMECMKEIYSAFNVTITDEDPGTIPHIESVVTKSPSEIGESSDVGGVAPFSCGVIDNAVVYTFAQVWGNNPRDICETAAQETAHAFGLDHEYYCPDPMTYLWGCGDKTFRDYDAYCGEYEPRSCTCGGSRQNSYEALMDVFGARENEAPTVEITTPLDGDAVETGFVIEADVEDDVGVEEVEFLIDNEIAYSDSSYPYRFTTSTDLVAGEHTIVVRAYDASELSDEQSIGVTLLPPCEESSECDDGYVCADGRCVLGPGTETGLGESCASGDDCYSGICGDSTYCVEMCDITDSNDCPDGFDCAPTNGEEGVCWPSDGDNDVVKDGCCSIVGRGSGTIPWASLILAACAFVYLRRRR